jgi:hypothetical protein
MKKLLISLLIVVTIGLIGCIPPGKVGQGTASPQAQGPENVPQAIPSPPPVAENPPEVVPKSRYEILAEKPPELVPGARYIYKRTNVITDDSQILISKIKSTVNWMGTAAYIVELSKQEGTNSVVTGYLVINTNLNTLAILDKDGKLLQAIKSPPSATAPQDNSGDTPCIKIYDWPLTLGKSFSAEYEIFNNTDKKSYKLTDQIAINDNLILVKLPIGDRTTYRIQRTTPGAIEAHYYSPEIGIEVKQEVSQTVDNPEGAGVFVVTLIGYNIPGVGQVGQGALDQKNAPDKLILEELRTQPGM